MESHIQLAKVNSFLKEAFTLALYTLGIIVVDIAYKTGTNNNVTPANINLLTDKDVTNLTLGSKVQLVAWYEYITFIYLLGDIYCGHLNPYIWLLSNFKQFASSPSPFESLLLQAAKLLR
ncbi:hypothetical protein HBH61_069350 [Parastagonospora nodorum]|nr:hypothetical protein HBI03_090540 [Parastagonospora nodorum]KAH4708075.1 hypothetical protein HBH67_072430 [Parastagonospora nodorum]KAH4814108.1 hypothetical protein HBH61_069350 [Parastagonospora nodorum]KAH5005517.1 hypothetical protein HBI77_117630 [Parastagonospora nodorum]KAH5061480.1 hypothetical protein HBH96_074800 [Parastagonospora nodorum]